MRKIKIGDKEYNYSCSAYTYIHYKKVFNKSIFEDIRALQEYLIKKVIVLNELKQKIPNITEEELGKNLSGLMLQDNIEAFVESAIKITYILVKEADENIEEYEEWLKTIPALKINDEWIVEVAEFAVDCFC